MIRKMLIHDYSEAIGVENFKFDLKFLLGRGSAKEFKKKCRIPNGWNDSKRVIF